MTINDITSLRGFRLCRNLYNFTQKDNYYQGALKINQIL